MSLFDRSLTRRDYPVLGVLAISWYLGSMGGGIAFHETTMHEWGWGHRSDVDVFAPLAGIIVSLTVPGAAILTVLTAGASLLFHRRALWAAWLIGVVGFGLSTYWTSLALFARG